jgi:hypothetical protein
MPPMIDARCVAGFSPVAVAVIVGVPAVVSRK